MPTLLETARLRLRHLGTGDETFILALLNEPAFIRNIGDRKVRTLEDAARYIAEGPVASYERHGFGLFLVELKDDGTPVGICGLLKRPTLEDADIGFAFLAEYRGRGYASESAAAVMEYAREVLGLERVVAVTTVSNIPSISVLEKLGMSYEGMVKWDDASELKLFARNMRRLGSEG